MKRYFWIGLIILTLALVAAQCGPAPAAPPAAEKPAAQEPAAEKPAATEEAKAEAPAATEEAKAEAPAATEEAKTEAPADAASKYQIPSIEEGKFNVAFVLVGPHDDGGWSQAHDVGRMYVEENVEGVHTAYVENVAEGADAEQVIRSLARKGFNVIFTTSFGFMDASEVVANEFPDINIIHISGYKTNNENFGNLMGAMEI